MAPLSFATFWVALLFIFSYTVISHSTSAAEQQDSLIEANQIPLLQPGIIRKVPSRGGTVIKAQNNDPRHDPQCGSVTTTDRNAVHSECSIEATCDCGNNEVCLVNVTAIWKDNPPACLLGWECEESCEAGEGGPLDIQTEQ